MPESESQGFNTRAIHVGQEPDTATGATIVPIYATSTYTQDGLGQNKGYEYARGDNPTREALEEVLASLEHGTHAVAFASGMAAADAVIRQLKTEDEIVAGHDLYGGVYRLFERVYRAHGISTRYVDLSDANRLEAAITPKTRMVWLESPTNPLLEVVDIAALAAIAHRHGLLVVVDNTFASPYLQNPLVLGADVVVHSTTKYLGGHSDVIGGAVVVNDEDLFRDLKFIQNAAGAIIGPFEAWLTLRGIKTLGVRMDRHQANASHIAHFLQNQPEVQQVYYPELFEGSARQIWQKQMRGAGGMVSFQLNVTGSDVMTRVGRVLEGFRVFSLAESLGGVESLVGHPATMTHASIPREDRMARGITDSLIRLSVGIEDVHDLEADIRRALAGVGGA